MNLRSFRARLHAASVSVVSMRSQLCCLLLMLAVSPLVSAQVVVTATAGTPVGAYTTLKQGFDAINDGTHQGNVAIAITGNTIETAPAVLNASGSGAANYLLVQVTPTGGGTRVISGTVPGALVDLAGADNVTFDGLNSGGNRLTLSNSDPGASATLLLRDDASNNQFRRITLLGAGSGGDVGVVTLRAGVATGNDNNLWTACSIGAAAGGTPRNGFYASGAASPADHSGNTLTNCDVSDFFDPANATSGIRIESGNSGWTVSNNRLFQSAPRAYTAGNLHRGIVVQGGDGHVVSGNVIGYASSGATGTYTMSGSGPTFIAIDLNVGNAVASSVQGNVISGINLSTTSSGGVGAGILCGIRVAGGEVRVGNVIGNTVGGPTGVDLLVGTTSGTGGLVTGMNVSGGSSVIEGNTIGGLTAQGTSGTVGVNVNGITVTGSPTALTIQGNTIGNGAAQNMRAGAPASTANTGASGISIATTTAANVQILGNSIRNFVSHGSGTSAFVRGIWSAPAANVNTAISIRNNVIAGLSTNSGLSGVANGHAAVVGINVAHGNGPVIADNEISDLARVNAGSGGGTVAGIAVGNATATEILRNRIWDLRNASTSTSALAPAAVAGILIRSGSSSATAANNMIALGSGQATGTWFVGIWANHGSTPNPIDRIYFNSIHISGAAAAGTVPSSFGFHLGDFSANPRAITVDIRNNILSNVRTGGNGSHFAIGNNFGTTAASSWAPGSSDFNLLNANASTIGAWNGPRTFADWKVVSSSDGNSASNQPVTFVNASQDLHLNMGNTPTRLESGGVAIDGFGTDIDGQTRPGPVGSVLGGALAPDLGADEFDGAFLDGTAPAISYQPLERTSLTGDRSLTVSITDAGGIPTVGANVPRVYFAKVGFAYVSRACSLASGTASNSSWTCTIASADMGGLVTGNAVTYFVVAQDLAGNVNANPGIGFAANSVNDVTTLPSNPNGYTIALTYSGVYDVGTGAAITSLTNAGGLFDLLNQGVLVGDATFRITSDLTAETGNVALNDVVEDGVGGYTLTLRPFGGARLISGDRSGPLIRLVGVDRLRVEGSTSGATAADVVGGDPGIRELTIENTNLGITAGVIAIFAGTDGAQQNTFRNLVLQGGVALTSGALFRIDPAPASTPGTFNAGTRIENCAFRGASVGISALGVAATPSPGSVIVKNDMTGTGDDRIGRMGILVTGEDGTEIGLNRIAIPQTVESQDAAAIAVGSASISAAVPAIGTVSNARIYQNDIRSVSSESTFSAVGIFLAPPASGNAMIANNAIVGVIGNATPPDIVAGIMVTAVPGASTRVLNNSVILAGDRGGATMPSYGLAIQGDNPSVEVRNNTLSNGQFAASANATSYGIGLSATTFTAFDADYNNFFVTGPRAAFFRTGSLEAAVGVNLPTLADWQAATGDDAQSLAVDPLHVSTSDVHLTNSSPLLARGTPIAGIDVDIDQQVRAPTAPCIGADEVIDVDLQIDKDNDAQQLVSGTSTVYALVVANAGPVPARNARLTDPLPATLTSGSWMCVPAQSTATCPTPGAGTGSLDTLVNLGVGQHLRFDVMATVNGSVGGFVTNTASVAATATQNDPTTANNNATDEDPIVGVGLFANGFESSGKGNVTVPAAREAVGGD